MLILQHKLKENGKNRQIEIVKEYGKIPPVQCYAGQLNQVFMNIVSNAIDALADVRNRRLELASATDAQRQNFPSWLVTHFL